MPKVSIVMPTFNAERYLKEAADSILNQTYQDFELLAIDDYSKDRTRKILNEYCDSRIKVIDGPNKGLCEALNLGIRLSAGEYIARMDADDIALPQRLEKQVKYMDENPNVGICGSWQQHFGTQNWVHKPGETSAQNRANLLFFCDLCHSTLMLRRRVLINNNLFYNNRYASEDYQLWTRAMDVTDIVNLQEVLGKYRHGEDNITIAKFKKIDDESGRIVAETLWRTLGMHIAKEDIAYFNSWTNRYCDAPNAKEKRRRLDNFERLLREIWYVNQQVEYYEPQSLLNVFAVKWGWAKYNNSLWKNYKISTLDDVFAI